MQIKDLTVPELNRFRTYCNFTSDEMDFFNLRAGGATLEECCAEMDYSLSTVNRLSSKVKSKMRRV